MKRDINILKAIGIIMVVLGHITYNPFTWYQPYSFHIGLFFFISGYFYKEKNEQDKRSFFKSKFKGYIVPYFKYNLFYMLLTYLLYLKYNIKLGELPSFKSFFILPFIDGQQYHLYLATWFLIELFIVQLTYILFYPSIKFLTKNMHIHLLIFVSIGLLSIILSKINFDSDFRLVIIRTLFGLCFYFFGFYYGQKIENKNIFTTTNLLISMLIEIILVTKYGDIGYTVSTANFRQYTFVPFLAGVNGIFICIFVSKSLSKFLPKNDTLLDLIGENTFSIMCNHLLIFFIINFMLLKLHKIDISQLNSVWYSYKPNTYWSVYATLGVLIPALASYFYKKYSILCKRQILSYLHSQQNPPFKISVNSNVNLE